MEHRPVHMNSFFFRWRYIIALALSAAILLCNSCSKKDINNITGNTLEQYFESSILNRDFVVDLATDTAHDITVQYTGYIFRLQKNTLFDGPMTCVKGNLTFNGTWSCNSDYSKLAILLNHPSVPSEFVFINRAWRFVNKDLPVMELSPWGTTDPKVLHMRRL